MHVKVLIKLFAVRIFVVKVMNSTLDSSTWDNNRRPETSLSVQPPMKTTRTTLDSSPVPVTPVGDVKALAVPPEATEAAGDELATEELEPLLCRTLGTLKDLLLGLFGVTGERADWLVEQGSWRRPEENWISSKEV